MTQPPHRSLPNAHRFSHRAMATEFAIYIVHADATYARQAAAEAFELLDRLEQELSRYVESSDVSQINNLENTEPLRIGLATFDCLQRCQKLHADTNGAFDVTVGFLLDCWRRADKAGKRPSREDLRSARRRTGMRRVTLDEKTHTVRLPDGPVRIDLGGVGKGYAVDQMAALLGEWDIDTALIHGGRSSILALDVPPGAKGWPLTLDSPDTPTRKLATVRLRNRALSGSGLKKGRHMIDPQSGRPVEKKRAAWCLAPDAATADALSTAFLIMSPKAIERYCAKHPKTVALTVTEDEKAGPSKTVLRQYGPRKGEDPLRILYER